MTAGRARRLDQGEASGKRNANSRPADDFYETPRPLTEALLQVENFHGRRSDDFDIWEPACGNGAMSKVLESEGYAVFSSNLTGRGYGTIGVDFLLEQQLWARNVVTNPPFTLAEQFVIHALQLGADKVAMLLRLQFLEGAKRYREIFKRWPPARVWTFSKRQTIGTPEFYEANGYGATKRGGVIAYSWFVWTKDHKSPGYTGGWL